MSSVDNVKLTFQGSLVKVHHPSTVSSSSRGGTRGKVRSFSRSSRKRLLERYARMSNKGFQQKPAVFVTLTYPKNYPTARVAKAHLNSLRKRLEYKFNIKASGSWKLEFQKRGAPHFHILFFNLPFLPKRDLQVMWAEIIGDETKTVFTRIERIQSRKKAMLYVSKYIAKMPDQDVSNDEFLIGVADELGGVVEFGSRGRFGEVVVDDSGFNYVSYLAESVGRFWGCWHEELFPYDELVAITVEFNEKIFYNLRRLAHNVYSGFRTSGNSNGFTLFVSNAYRWKDFYDWLNVEFCSLPA